MTDISDFQMGEFDCRRRNFSEFGGLIQQSDMLETINKQLFKYEVDNGFRILFAIEAGSRAWGFESPDSDYDVRFVYRRPLSHYLSITAHRDVFEPKCEHPLDCGGWDIKKALYQIYKGNPCFFEWLNSPIVYQEAVLPSYKDELIKLSKSYFNPRTAIYHYLHMAQGNFREYLRGDEVWTKKYLYVIRPILCCLYIEAHHSMPPVLFHDLFKGDHLVGVGVPLDEIEQLVRRKKEGLELSKGPKIELLNKWLDGKISYFADKARITQKVEVMPDDLNEYFLNCFQKW